MCILVGALAAHHPQAALFVPCQQIAKKNWCNIRYMTDGANSAGAWLAGAVPHRRAGGVADQSAGLSAYEMLEKPRKAYILLNVEPELDCANAAHAIAAHNKLNLLSHYLCIEIQY